MPNELLKPEDVLDGRYVVTHVHRVSGLGALYEARDRQHGNGLRYAIKEEIIQAHPLPDQDALVEDFERRVEMLVQLVHPGIPRFFGGFTEGPRTYLVMEFVEGQDLEDVLSTTTGFLSISAVYNWAVHLCEVLDYLHTRQPDPIVFRDLKPANVMIDPTGLPRLVDYGLACPYEPGKNYPPLGTDGYAAPEQYEGQVAPAVDIYGLGATLHHLLTRRDPRLEPPFSFGRRPVRKINPTCPWELSAIVMRALAYDPADRFASAAEMLDALYLIG